jgi:hypothetical protein
MTDPGKTNPNSMDMKVQKVKAITMAICALIAIVIIVDYSLSGTAHVEKVLSISRSLEKYYNAGGNSHYSYKIKTENHNFNASEEFATLVKKGQELKIGVYPIFQEVNSSVIIDNGHKETYSLRILTGLLLPLLALVIFGIGYKFGERVGTLVWVAEAALVVNFIYLLK